MSSKTIIHPVSTYTTSFYYTQFTVFTSLCKLGTHYFVFKGPFKSFELLLLKLCSPSSGGTAPLEQDSFAVSAAPTAPVNRQVSNQKSLKRYNLKLQLLVKRVTLCSSSNTVTTGP